MMVWAPGAMASTASSRHRLRSSGLIEKNSPCLPHTNSPAMLRSSVQWRTFSLNPSSSSCPSSVNGVSAAAQIPFMLAWA